MVNPLDFLNPGNVPASSPEEAIALLSVNPTPENQKLIADLKQSIKAGLQATVPGNASPTMVNSLNDSLPQGLTPLGFSPSGKAGYFRRADGALVGLKNGTLFLI